MLQVTCFLPDLSDVASARASVAAAFPSAAANLVQLTRLSVDPKAACEGVGRLVKAPRTPVEFRETSVLVNSPKLVFTGIQMAFRDREEDLRLAYERLRRALESVHAGYAGSLVLDLYALNNAVADKAAALAREFLGPSARPVGSAHIVEGLPSLDATVAIELIAFGP